MRKLVAIVLMFTAVLIVSAVPAGAETATTSQMEQEFVSLINELRVSKGLAPFETHPQLVDKARNWSAVMSAEGRIWHSELSDGIQAPWRRLGENVGMGGSVRSLHDAFVASPGHYQNLIDPDFRLVGLGVVIDPDGTIFVSQVFMQLQDTSEKSVTPAASADQAAPSATEADSHRAAPASAVAGVRAHGASAEPDPAATRPALEPVEEAQETGTESARPVDARSLATGRPHSTTSVTLALVAIVMLALAAISLSLAAQSRLARAARRNA